MHPRAIAIFSAALLSFLAGALTASDVQELPQFCAAPELPQDKWEEAKKNAIAENSENNYIPKESEDNGKRPAGYTDKGVFSSGRKWKNGRTLQILFLNGSQQVRDKVQLHAKEWEKYANLKFDFVAQSPAEIRISFKSGGSWSTIGTDALTVPVGQPTMNFGWVTATSAEESDRAVVQHEFGHAIGLNHEHNHPQGGIQWNKPRVYSDMAKQRWTKEQVDFNIFSVYNNADAVLAPVDKKSIMMYPIPPEWTTNGFKVGRNTSISDDDKEFIAAQYPKPRK